MQVEVGPGSRFTWTTFGVRLQSEVTLYERNHALGWLAIARGGRAFHRWHLYLVGRHTRVVTEECQRGILPRLTKRLFNPGLHAAHQLWLERLRDRVEHPE